MSVICETFIPRDRRIYFYVPGSRFIQWRGGRAEKKGIEMKKRGTNERAILERRLFDVF